ncbi:flagellar biosynthetic protein FliR [Caldalkalibacillus mannanilyticus]|uniref:flagellar biosynthetic protein FliR n=1 Tax=Caldalkalibacillus mannanilyticus TaxID=1418 RepID=UPI000469BD06|nr:flagellar biosynthetic protein FliR [Caldalkalibacillus mannanilyticus]
MLIWLEQLPVFLLILVRITSFFVSAPIFSMKGVPMPFKVGLGVFISFVSYLTISVEQPIMLDFTYILLILKEAVIGLALGFVASLILYTVQVAGAFIDFQMGFAIANVVDPQTGAQVPILGNFKYMLALFFLLSVNGHHLLIDAVIKSYQMVPIDLAFVPIGSERVALFISSLFVQMFVVAFQLAIPIVGSLFLVDVALGFLARTVPQLNVFVVGLPLKILVGFTIILLTFATFFQLLGGLFRDMVDAMGQLLKLLGG